MLLRCLLVLLCATTPAWAEISRGAAPFVFLLLGSFVLLQFLAAGGGVILVLLVGWRFLKKLQPANRSKLPPTKVSSDWTEVRFRADLMAMHTTLLQALRDNDLPVIEGLASPALQPVLQRAAQARQGERFQRTVQVRSVSLQESEQLEGAWRIVVLFMGEEREGGRTSRFQETWQLTGQPSDWLLERREVQHQDMP